MAESSRVTLALLGLGRAGNMHLTSIRHSHRCSLKYIVDIPSVLPRVRETLSKYNMTGVTAVSSEDLDAVVLADDQVQAVIVTTPTYLHEELVCKSLNAGKAVFCEKPIAQTIEAVKACYRAAEKAKQPLFCAFQRRFDPHFVELRQNIQDGKLGNIHMVKSTSRDSPLPSMEYMRHSSGMFHDTSVHDIDLACWILGEEPNEVYAQAHCHHQEIAEMDDVDTIAIVLKFPSGVLCTIDLSRHSSYGYDQRIEVFGDKGFGVVENPNKSTVVMATKDGISRTPYVYSFPTRFKEAYLNELHHFLDCTLDHTLSLEIQEIDTLRATRVVEACERSYKSKKAEKLLMN